MMTTDRLEDKDNTGRLAKTEDEWKQQLTPDEYRVTREKGTERAFTGAYYATKEPGTYSCTCCGQDLFESQTKFDSGTGWPSFYAPSKDGSVKVESDTTYGMVRTEVLCSRCDAHLGHVFPDGPQPTGQRYCINSISLKHRPTED